MNPAGPATPAGIVYLVGAGPGDPGLLTLKGRRCLECADVVFYDYLANPCLLDYAPAAAERILVGKHGDGFKFEQNELNRMLIEHARAGRTVVRLKGGDPFLFGRGGEEAEALAGAAVAFEVVPGISAALAVPAYSGIPLTHRDFASAVTILTGYEYPDKSEPAVHWDVVARRGGTLVFLMTTRQLAANMEKLAAAGMDPATPVAVIRWGTRAEHETIAGTVGTIAALVAERGLQPPALAVVGDVVRLHQRLNWYERKPLFGRRIVVTRPRAQATSFIETLSAAGAEVIPCPTIEIVAPASSQPLDAAIAGVQAFDWLVFTSVNGVEKFFERLRQLERDVRVLHRARLAAVGPQTAQALAERGLRVDVMPEEFRAEGVAEAMQAAGVSGQRVLLPRAAGAREILPVMLRAAGAVVEEVASYDTVRPNLDVTELRRQLTGGAVDLVTFTSSSTVRNFLELLGGDAVALLARAAIGCIGPITADTARELGLHVSIQPSAYTIAAFTRAIIAHFAATPRRSRGPAATTDME
ncbi:MAG: uroporphyrinogen-III C-methyltransferase [Deltaproteobacteria bacterium]|nr:uroporphyrinogen-III C-methyltransferase [Deltaproteobacteria bacterium]